MEWGPLCLRSRECSGWDQLPWHLRCYPAIVRGYTCPAHTTLLEAVGALLCAGTTAYCRPPRCERGVVAPVPWPVRLQAMMCLRRGRSAPHLHFPLPTAGSAIVGSTCSAAGEPRGPGRGLCDVVAQGVPRCYPKLVSENQPGDSPRSV